MHTASPDDAFLSPSSTWAIEASISYIYGCVWKCINHRFLVSPVSKWMCLWAPREQSVCTLLKWRRCLSKTINIPRNCWSFDNYLFLFNNSLFIKKILISWGIVCMKCVLVVKKYVPYNVSPLWNHFWSKK